MGNNPSTKSLGSAGNMDRGRRKSQLLEEEYGYMPMTSAMRRALVDGRKFQHVVPGRVTVVEIRTPAAGEAKMKDRQKIAKIPWTPGTTRAKLGVTFGKDNINGSQSKVSITELKTMDINSSGLKDSSWMMIPQRYKEQDVYKVECEEIIDRSKSLQNLNVAVNRSEFTLELENRMRLSKFELGFDPDPNGWREFSYKDVKGNTKSEFWSPRKENCVKKVTSGESTAFMQYCANNCHIMSAEPSIFKEEMSRKYNVKHLLNRKECNCELCTLAYLTDMSPPQPLNAIDAGGVKRMRVGRKSHESGSARTGEVDLSGGSKVKNVSEVKSYARQKRGRLNILNKEDRNWGTNESTRRMRTFNLSRPSTVEDSTNLKIRERFQTNAPSSPKNEHSPANRSQPCVTNIDRSINSCNSQMSDRTVSGVTSSTFEGNQQEPTSSVLESDSSSEGGRFRKTNRTLSGVRILDNNLVDSEINIQESKSNLGSSGKCRYNGYEINSLRSKINKSPRIRLCSNASTSSRRCNCKSTSTRSTTSTSSSIGASLASSLSTVMSYHRVRKIFQNIIEHRHVKRSRRNTEQFREMQQLGLGQMRHHRWYPSECKTYSIWSGLHSSVTGVQAQFKKYHKPMP